VLARAGLEAFQEVFPKIPALQAIIEYRGQFDEKSHQPVTIGGRPEGRPLLFVGKCNRKNAGVVALIETEQGPKVYKLISSLQFIEGHIFANVTVKSKATEEDRYYAVNDAIALPLKNKVKLLAIPNMGSVINGNILIYQLIGDPGSAEVEGLSPVPWNLGE
jgi:hypothetical protein